MDISAIKQEYSRSQAIREGVLADVSGLAATIGFQVPVALSRLAWERCVAWQPAPAETDSVDLAEGCRLLNVLTSCWQAVREQLVCLPEFPVTRIPSGGTAPEKVWLKVETGSGDWGEPVITIFTPDE